MEMLIERIKETFWMFATAFLSVLTPVKNVLIFLMLGFLFNIIIGLIADIHVNRERFKIKKAFNALTQLFFYSTCAVFFDYGTRLLGDPSLGQTAVKWLTYIVAYFYVTNIFKNACLIWPRNKAVQLIYQLLSTEIFDRLKSYIGYKSKNKTA